MENLLKLLYDKIDERKGEDIKIIDIKELSIMSDYFIIATGNNSKHVVALADMVEEELAKQGMKPSHIEGYQTANWILMDYGDFIVHIFDKDSRSFYDLERIWKGGKSVEI